MMETPCRPMFKFPSTPASPNVVCRSASADLSIKNGLESEDDENKLPLDKEKYGFSGGDGLEASSDFHVGFESSDDAEKFCNLLSINCGELDKCMTCHSTEFQKDNFFQGGDVTSTYEMVGGEKGSTLYQTARSGSFSYKFLTLEPGNYFVDLYFAEIIFTQGPPGMRVFDVLMQGEKVVPGLDIYARVGSNKPLILSNLNATVHGDEGLVVSFDEVNGIPLICGISIRRPSLGGKGLQMDEEGNLACKEVEKVKGKCCDCKNLKREYDLLCKAQAEIKGALEDARRDNELKSKECHEAWMSLQDLQTELLRKSMHMGSLAFAVEGQVKERTLWLSALKELTEKLKLLKNEHTELQEAASQYRTSIREMVDSLASVQLATKDQDLLVMENQDLKRKYIKEAKWRKELYNKLLETRGNIRVICRCRPLNIEETSRGISTVVDCGSAKDGELLIKALGAPRRVFKFDSVFGPDADQGSVFLAAAPLVTSVLDGYNVCIFAYGQTGTGKTFTMEGTADARGVSYKTLEELFHIIDERKALFQYEVSVSVLEVYNEQIRDLLLSDTHPGGGSARRLEIKQAMDGAHAIPGLVEASVSNMYEVWDVLQTGSNGRAVGSTSANEHSSRSHCIHCVMVKGKNLMNGECTRSKLWLVDLAGSERVAKTDVQGERLKEAQNINKSLSALGDVISALATKSPHIPFRNSKLTHLLQDSLGGASKTLMFVQISPCESDLNETICSLNFASRVRGIELGPAKKQLDGSETLRCKLLEKSRQDNKGKDVVIKKLEGAIHCMDEKLKAKETTNKALQEKVKELEAQLLVERKLVRQHIDKKLAENVLQQQDGTTTISKLPPKTEKPTAVFREIGNMIAPATENKVDKTTSLPLNDSLSKENKPEFLDEATQRKLSISISNLSPGMPMVAKRVNRLSMYAAQRVHVVPAPRRSSVVPLESHCHPVQPLAADILSTSSNITSIDKINGPRGNKKNKSILSRSLQKKVMVRPQNQQSVKKGGNLEKINGRMRARRVPVNKVVNNQKRQEREWK